uniref:C-type lectin domain-containing protein n=1 Tax=Acrobeloides nanus TaxID=290746 RepID=A0A914CK21_9BILA
MYSTLPSTDVESSSWSSGHMHFIEVCKPFTMVATSSGLHGQPNSSGQCISVTSSNSQWSSIDCNTAQYYVCKIQATVDSCTITTCPTNKPVIPDTTIRSITINDCESGWTYYNITNLCYKVFHGFNCTASEAICVQNGGHLVSIHSLEENVFISELAQAGYTFGNDGAWGRYHVLIGLVDPTLNGHFYWTDGSPYDYQRWCSSPALSEGCTTLYADQDTAGCFQEWGTDYEEIVHRAFVCQKSSIAHICQN